MGFPEDVAGEVGRLVSAPARRADVDTARASAARVADVKVKGLHVEIGGAQDRLPMALYLDVVGDFVRGVCPGRAPDRIEP